MRCARLTGQGTDEPSGVWCVGRVPLTAIDPQGGKLWTQPAGIDDVWAADLDGDGKDEVIVGYNGGKGLHVFGGDGEQRWKDTSIANVWHVTAGDLDGDGHFGDDHSLGSRQSSRVRRPRRKSGHVRFRRYSNMVRVFRRPNESTDSVLVVGSGRAMPRWSP